MIGIKDLRCTYDSRYQTLGVAYPKTNAGLCSPGSPKPPLALISIMVVVVWDFSYHGD